MRLSRRLRVSVSLNVALLLAAVGMTACHHAPSTANGTPDLSAAQAGAQAEAGPMNDRDRMRAEQWAKATEGLDFESRADRIEVDRAFPSDATRAPEHVAEGDALLGANRIMDALKQYALAARNDPYLADAFVGIGRVLVVKGKLDHAIKTYRTAVALDAEHEEGRYQLAMALWAADLRTEAVTEMTAVLVLDADHARAHERLAVWSYYTGEYATAWRHLRRAESLGGTVPAQLPSLLERHMPDPDALN